MQKLTDLLDMGGYAAYVWPSFLIAALILAGMTITSLRQLRATQARLARLQAEADET